MTETSKEIETVFIERTKQVLKYKGLAGLVLPTSIFESGGIYIKARDILLKYFEIKGITILGNKTFFATDVKTLIVFLKRRDDDFLKDREYIASDLFSNTNYTKNIRYLDANRFLKMYLEYRGFELEHYEKFLKFEVSEDLSETDMFIEYRNLFDNSTDTKNQKKKTSFKNLTPKKQEENLKTLFYNFCKDIEKEKFVFFLLCLSDGDKKPETLENYYNFQQTVVIKTGKQVEDQKEFLGYDISKRKRQEGVKLNKSGSKLFDETNPLNPQRASSYIRKSIIDEEITVVDSSVEKNVQVFSLAELLDFDQIDFDKKISPESISKTNWEDVWGSTEIKPLSPDIAIVQKGSSITKTKTVEGKIPVIAGGQQPAYFHNVSNRSKNIITVSASGAYAGFLNFWDTEIFASDCTTIKSINEDELSTNLLYEILKVNQIEMYKMQRGQAQPHVYPRDISKIKIPVPTKEQQKVIISELKKLDNNRGKFLAKGVSTQELDKILQEEKKKIIIKNCFIKK